MNRRQILKLGLSSAVLALVSPSVLGQSSKTAASVSSSNAAVMDDTISYNAGWVIQLDDKARLLEIEARRTKEKEELAKQKSTKPSDGAPPAKEKSKSFGDKIQDWVGKIKNVF
jgi:hypothetical protein